MNGRWRSEPNESRSKLHRLRRRRRTTDGEQVSWSESNMLHTSAIARRHFLRDCGVGLGKIALGSLLAGSASGAPSSNPFAPKKSHFPGKARAVIHLFM